MNVCCKKRLNKLTAKTGKDITFFVCDKCRRINIKGYNNVKEEPSLKVLFVGLGSIGKRHLFNVKQLFPEALIACLRSDRSKEVDDDLITFYDIKKALKFKPDAVFITNPTKLHLRSAFKFVSAGCSVFVEKPVSTSSRRVEELLLLATERKVKVMVGFNMRFNKVVNFVKNVLDDGLIGFPRCFRASVGQWLPDWHPGEDYSVGYAAKKCLGGGALLTLIHELDYVYWLCGGFSLVNSFTGKISDLNIDVEDVVELTGRFKRGIVSVHLDYLSKPIHRTLSVTCSNGRLEADLINNSCTVFYGNGSKAVYNFSSVKRNDMYLDEVKEFFKTIKEDKKVNNKDVVEVMKMVDKIKKGGLK